MNVEALDPLLIIVRRLELVSPADQADAPVLLESMSRRSLEERHDCVLCPGMGRFAKRARFVLVIGPDPFIGPARWLDLCPPCFAAVQVMHARWPGNEAVVERYHELEKEGLVLPLDLQ